MLYISKYTQRRVSRIHELNDALSRTVGKVLICGDFNSKSTLWGSLYTIERGTTIEEWAAENDLRLLNSGTGPTCIRAQDTSIVDLTWGTLNLVRQIKKWSVMDVITLSDHAYICMFERHSTMHTPSNRVKLPRWNLKKVDWGRLQESLL